MAEYDRIQKKQESRAVANSEIGSRQLKGFVDNRREVMIKQNLSNKTAQFKFYPPLPPEGQEWNDLLDKIKDLNDRHKLPNYNNIQSYINTSEENWYDETDHSLSVNHFNFIYTLKCKVKHGLEKLKIDPNDVADWDDILKIINKIKDIGYFDVIIAQNISYDGGKGTTWYLVEPDLRGGWKYSAKGDRELKGAIGDCKNAISFHNGAVDLEIENWD